MITKLKKVLIVEDDLSQKQLWNFVISRVSESAEVDWAVSSEQALTMIKKNKSLGKLYDLLIVDLFLAGSETGLDLLKSEEVVSAGPKTILVSAIDQKNFEDQLRQELAHIKLIIKPLNIIKCENTIVELVS